MKFLLDATAIDPGPSGARTRLLHLLAEYVHLPRRHDIVVLTPKGRGLTTELGEVGVECVETDPAPPPFQRWRRDASYFDEWLERTESDALQAEMLPVPLTTRPLLLTIHDLRDLERPPLDPRAFYAHTVLSRDLARVERVIAVSQDTANLLVQRLKVRPGQISIVKNAPDPAVRREDSPELIRALYAAYALPDRFVLALGHVEPRKNLALLVQAIRRLRKDPRFGDVGVVLCGRDVAGEGDRIRSLAAKAPAIPLLLTGPLTPIARNALLGLAACVCTPSKIEGFGIVPLEAMAAGVPSIVARARALEETVGDAALTCDPDDPDELAAQIGRVLCDEGLREVLIAKGRERAATFTWRTAAQALLEAHDFVAVAHSTTPLQLLLQPPEP